MPDFSRDDVEIAAQGTLVVALQTGTEEITDSTELDYVWLTKQGVYEQITISDSSEKATTTIGSEEQSVWVNSSNKFDETKAAAQQIANNIGTTATINDVVYSVSVNDDRDIVLTTTDPVTSEEVTYTLETQQDGTVVLKDDEGAPVDSSVATVASVVAQAVEEGGIDASAAEHLAYSVLKGDGTINNPYDIYNVETYIAFITMHLYNGETDYYYVAGDGIVYGNITDDIDFTGVTLPTPTVDYYNVVIEGNGHTLSNSNRALFTINGDWYGDKNEIRNLNIVNCNTGHTLLGTAPVWNDSSAKIVLSNINDKNCSCKNGVFAYYAGSSTMIFNNCNVEATTIQGGNGIALGGFVCNNSTGHTEFNNCSFGGNVISVSEAVSSFMGQGSSNTVFNNCAVKAGTSIRNLKTNGVAYAFGNSYASTSHDNTFEGTLYTTSMAKAYGNGVVEVSSANWQQQAVLSASDFVINSDGSITYNGSSTLSKVTVDVKASRDTITIGVNDSYGGYPYPIQDTITANNVASGSSITGLTKITSAKNVVSEESDLTLIGRSIKDNSIFGDDSKAGDIKIVGNTLYLNSCRYGTHNDKLIAWADSFDKVAQVAKNSELSINLTVIVYDATGNLVSSIGLSYKVPVE